MMHGQERLARAEDVENWTECIIKQVGNITANDETLEKLSTLLENYSIRPDMLLLSSIYYHHRITNY